MRRSVAAAHHRGGRSEVLVQVVDPLEPTPLGRAGERGEVEHRQVLDDLAQADAAGVRADRHAELRGRQQVGLAMFSFTVQETCESVP
jgi:hypothetical protein